MSGNCSTRSSFVRGKVAHWVVSSDSISVVACIQLDRFDQLEIEDHDRDSVSFIVVLFTTPPCSSVRSTSSMQVISFVFPASFPSTIAFIFLFSCTKEISLIS